MSNHVPEGMEETVNNWNQRKQKTAYEISACLVGSEMCIRDSSKIAVAEDAKDRPHWMGFVDYSGLKIKLSLIHI